METYRLKNIAIVILLLLNACLLLMAGQQQLQSLRAQRRAAAQLRESMRAGVRYPTAANMAVEILGPALKDLEYGEKTENHGK